MAEQQEAEVLTANNRADLNTEFHTDHSYRCNAPI